MSQAYPPARDMTPCLEDLRTWAHSTSSDGARSPANRQFLEQLLGNGSLLAVPGMEISTRQELILGSQYIFLYFLHPRGQVIIWVPAACIETGLYRPDDIFNSLLEEIIGWVAGAGYTQSIFRVYRRSLRQDPVPFNPSEMQMLYNGFETFIDSIRQPQASFPGPGRIGGSYGEIKIGQVVDHTGEVTECYAVSLTLASRHRMMLFLPKGITQLPKDWILDWLKVRNEFAIRVIQPFGHTP